jgi:ABC-type dipeptide/oligopeptide/nickel transport system permease component
MNKEKAKHLINIIALAAAVVTIVLSIYFYRVTQKKTLENIESAYIQGQKDEAQKIELKLDSIFNVKK